MDAQPDPEPARLRVIVVEVPIPGVLIGHLPVLLLEPADPEVGWSTTDDQGW